MHSSRRTRDTEIRISVVPFDRETTQIPNPSHRHAGPSAPWPWIDLSDKIDPKQLESELPAVPPLCTHAECEGSCWKKYPESRFPNWKGSQVQKCKIKGAINRNKEACTLYYVDVDDNGRFRTANETVVTTQNISDSWNLFVEDKRQSDLRVRAIFLENLSGPVLQMLGAKFNIEPFFWSSSLNWIPSRYQEDLQTGESDHITICLTFLRSMPKATDTLCASADRIESFPHSSTSSQSSAQGMIDTQAPLPLLPGQVLVPDLLSVHLIRNAEGSTIISYHPSSPHWTTRAKDLHQRIRLAGQSVYWQKIFQASSDPTFMLLTFLWYALYAWDEALEHLYTHICTLETHVIETNEMELTHELHVIRAHQLHYSSLLENFAKTVKFIQNTENPALLSIDEGKRKHARQLMNRECEMLLGEIRRLDMTREMQDRRLKNVMNLVFSTVNIRDSSRMQRMTEAAVRDSSAMKQIAYLTMVFLPSSFVATVFGMNVKEISSSAEESLARYVGVALGMTLITIWIIIAFQSQYLLPKDYSFFKRLGWPVFLALQWFGWKKMDRADSQGSKPLLRLRRS